MNNAPSLNAAKNMLKEKRFQEATAILERIINDKSEDSAEAAYCLGIVHNTGSRVPKNVDEAEKYYLMAVQSGHPMATHRLGGICYKRGELQKAYDLFRSVAHINPSAAFWAYQLLTLDKQLDSDPDAGEKFLDSAAEQGHVRAQRIISMRYISGKEGLLEIPYGLRLFVRLARNVFRVTHRGEKMKYE
jgi:TPR repeat protein